MFSSAVCCAHPGRLCDCVQSCRHAASHARRRSGKGSLTMEHKEKRALPSVGCSTCSPASLEADARGEACACPFDQPLPWPQLTKWAGLVASLVTHVLCVLPAAGEHRQIRWLRAVAMAMVSWQCHNRSTGQRLQSCALSGSAQAAGPQDLAARLGEHSLQGSAKERTPAPSAPRAPGLFAQPEQQQLRLQWPPDAALRSPQGSNTSQNLREQQVIACCQPTSTTFAAAVCSRERRRCV